MGNTYGLFNVALVSIYRVNVGFSPSLEKYVVADGPLRQKNVFWGSLFHWVYNFSYLKVELYNEGIINMINPYVYYETLFSGDYTKIRQRRQRL